MAVEHLEGVAGAMTRREHQRVAGDAIAVPEHRRDNATFLHLDVRQGRLPSVDRAPGFGLFADEHGTFADHIRAHMGFGEVGDAWARAVAHEGVNDIARGRVADARRELAIAEGSGSAFAELGVGFGVEPPVLPQVADALDALAHGRPRSSTMGSTP